MTTRRTTPTKADLVQIRQELEALDPRFKSLKVKLYYRRRVKAFCSIGRRRIYVRAGLTSVVQRFTDMYSERLPTAF